MSEFSMVTWTNRISVVGMGIRMNELAVLEAHLLGVLRVVIKWPGQAV